MFENPDPDERPIEPEKTEPLPRTPKTDPEEQPIEPERTEKIPFSDPPDPFRRLG